MQRCQRTSCKQGGPELAGTGVHEPGVGHFRRNRIGAVTVRSFRVAGELADRPPGLQALPGCAWSRMRAVGCWLVLAEGGASHDPPEGPGPSPSDDPPRWDPH